MYPQPGEGSGGRGHLTHCTCHLLLDSEFGVLADAPMGSSDDPRSSMTMLSIQ